jgi:hypothetical protein
MLEWLSTLSNVLPPFLERYFNRKKAHLEIEYDIKVLREELPGINDHIAFQHPAFEKLYLGCRRDINWYIVWVTNTGNEPISAHPLDLPPIVVPLTMRGYPSFGAGRCGRGERP